MQQETMIKNRILEILNKISKARQINNIGYPVQLVAVSKTKTPQEIMEAYNQGVRNFGENYADQFEQKHSKLPMDINWHFIGHLQSNKIKKILAKNLYCIETVDRQSLAEKLNKQLEKQKRVLNVTIQIKTSKQQSKSGVQEKDLISLYQFIRNKCPYLNVIGLMTIGQEGDYGAFQKMSQLKEMLCKKYQLDKNLFQLSMGMSADFQVAIKYGSTSVRVGSSIFGARSYPKKQQQSNKKQELN